MPAAQWDTYRVGARLPSVDSLVTDAATSVQIEKLQRALSSVACIESSSLASTEPDDDALFVGRLLLGLLCRGWPTLASPNVEQALLDSIASEAGLKVREAGPNDHISWALDPNEPVPQRGSWELTCDPRRVAPGYRRLNMDEATVAMLTDSNVEQRFYREHLTPLLAECHRLAGAQRPLF